jgi:Tfp pilus assembly protein PilX
VSKINENFHKGFAAVYVVMMALLLLGVITVVVAQLVKYQQRTAAAERAHD